MVDLDPRWVIKLIQNCNTSHDAWENLPPKDAIAILRKAGVVRALVSSSGDDGTQRLLALAPETIVPSLRPYRTRSDVGGAGTRNRGARYGAGAAMDIGRCVR